MDLTGLVQEQTPSPQWGSFAEAILARGAPTPHNGTQSDEAHPPIHPTKYVNNLDDRQFKVYEVGKYTYTQRHTHTHRHALHTNTLTHYKHIHTS
jgi:hypothetical protein